MVKRRKTGPVCALPWQTKMLTALIPIPHPKWKCYETLRLARALRLEAEYKILRLPYMLGVEDSINDAGEFVHFNPVQDGNIFFLFGKGEP